MRRCAECGFRPLPRILLELAIISAFVLLAVVVSR